MDCCWPVEAAVEGDADGTSVIEATNAAVRCQPLTLGAAPGANSQELVALCFDPAGAVAQVDARIKMLDCAVRNWCRVGDGPISATHLLGALAGGWLPYRSDVLALIIQPAKPQSCTMQDPAPMA